MTRARCRHDVAPVHEWVWTPTKRRGILAKHSWCRTCGEVMGHGERAREPFGELVNTLGALERRLNRDEIRITEAQRRMIVRKLMEGARSPPVRGDLIVSAVSAYTGLTTLQVAHYLRPR